MFHLFYILIFNISTNPVFNSFLKLLENTNNDTNEIREGGSSVLACYKYREINKDMSDMLMQVNEWIEP